MTTREFNERVENLPLQGGGNEENMAELYETLEREGGPEAVARFQARWFVDESGQLIVGSGRGASHAKFASFDGRLMIMGSGNMDTQTWNHSREVNIVIDSPLTTGVWDETVFLRNWRRGQPIYPAIKGVDRKLGED